MSYHPSMAGFGRGMGYLGALLGGSLLAHASLYTAPDEVRVSLAPPTRRLLATGVSPQITREADARTEGPHTVWLPPSAWDATDTVGQGLAKELRAGRVITGATPHRLILFTFDDGPDRRTTPLLLDRLDAAGVKAVFFLTGNRLLSRNVVEREQALLAQEIVRRGHVAASHTLDHAQLPLLNDTDIIQQVVDVEQVFQRLLGGRPWLIRPPGGARSARVDRLLAERDYTTVMWNLGTGDFQVRTPEEVHATWKRVLERRERDYGERGGIILLHDTYPWSVDAFQLIVADLWDRNCRLMEEGEELYDIVDDPSFFYAPRQRARAGAEAPPARLDPHLLVERQSRLREVTAERCRRTAAL